QQSARTSPGTVCSLRTGGVPGSPAVTIVAKMDKQVIGYKDLAAIPKDKAILDIERPDLMMYEPHFSYSPMDRSERSLSPRSISPPPSPENSLSKDVRDWSEPKSSGSSSPTSTQLSKSITVSTKVPHQQQHFHRPETERRKNVASKTAEGEEGEEDDKYDDNDLSEDMWRLRQMQKQELNKIQSNLGKLILKEEIERSAPVRRKTRSLPDRTPMNLGTFECVFSLLSSFDCRLTYNSPLIHFEIALKFTLTSFTHPRTDTAMNSGSDREHFTWTL
ncbi:Dematin, partial [Anabarilius grahami]